MKGNIKIEKMAEFILGMYDMITHVILDYPGAFLSSKV